MSTLGHGHNRRGKRSRTYTAWVNMKARCKEGSKDAQFYYDRGIRVSKELPT